MRQSTGTDIAVNCMMYLNKKRVLSVVPVSENCHILLEGQCENTFVNMSVDFSTRQR